MRILFAMAVMTALPMTNCPNNDVVCTQEFVYGVNVNLTDAQTGQPITGATPTLICSCGRELPMEESPAQDGTYFGAGERPDTYSLTIQAPGYQDVTQENIVVESDVCHVIPVSLDIQMNPV